MLNLLDENVHSKKGVRILSRVKYIANNLKYVHLYDHYNLHNLKHKDVYLNMTSKEFIERIDKEQKSDSSLKAFDQISLYQHNVKKSFEKREILPIYTHVLKDSYCITNWKLDRIYHMPKIVYSQLIIRDYELKSVFKILSIHKDYHDKTLRWIFENVTADQLYAIKGIGEIGCMNLYLLMRFLGLTKEDKNECEDTISTK